MRHAEARKLASFYASPRTPHGQTLKAFCEARRVSRDLLADALETELTEALRAQDARAASELETLIEYCWA